MPPAHSEMCCGDRGKLSPRKEGPGDKGGCLKNMYLLQRMVETPFEQLIQLKQLSGF